MENRTTPRPNDPSSRRTQPPNDTSLDEALDETRGTADIEEASDVQLGGDTGFDRVVDADEAGLGGGLDQAEEAQLGVTDEELAEKARRAQESRS